MQGATDRPRRSLALPLTLAAMALALPLAAAGCGDDDEDDATTPTAVTGTTGETGAAAGGESVQISEVDFALEPDQVDVPAGPVTFEVTNDGETVHNLEIEGQGVEEVLPEDLQPGQSGTLEVELQPGIYEMYCPVGDHADMGMVGELTVE